MEPELPKLRINPGGATESEDFESGSSEALQFRPQRSLLPPPPSIVMTPPEAIIVINPEHQDSLNVKSGNFGKLVRLASQHFQETSQEAQRQSIRLNFYEKKPLSADSSMERSEDWHRFKF